MIPGELKPLLTALVLPPAGPLILLAVAALLAWRRWRRTAFALAAFATLSLGLLSSTVFAVWLAGALLPRVAPASPESVIAARTQAVVVLGGGIEPEAPEYGAPQPSTATLARLRYGVHLARATGLPLAFTGGVGWARAGTGVDSEARVAQAALAEWGVVLRWRDDAARDTQENAARMKEVLAAAGVTRIALVTHAWHMPRALRRFEAEGFSVVPAPTGFILAGPWTASDMLPSAAALQDSRAVLREWLALRLLP